MKPLSLLLVAVSALAQNAEILVAPNASVWVTPAMKAAQSLADSTARSPKDLLTVAEKSNWQQTGSYDEMVSLYRKLAAASPYARLLDIGETPQGRRMYILVASKDKTFHYTEVRKSGKPILFLQNGIHPGENGGKDAAFMLLRDILVTGKYAHFLDKMILLSIPVFNIDGHESVSPYNRINEQGPREMGFRVTAQRFNLNRDYMKADAPEMQNWIRAFNRFNPDMLIDNHVTDGQDLQCDTTIAIHDAGDVHPAVGEWVKQKWTPKMWSGMEALGHVLGWYVGGPLRAGANFTMLPMAPRFSTGYVANRNRAALLVETHSLKPFSVRAWGHYDIMLESMKVLEQHGAELRAATDKADRDLLNPGTRVALDYAPAKEGIPYVVRALETETYQGAALGGPVLRYLPKAREIPVTLVRGSLPKTEAVAPKGYYIPRQWSAVADLLKLHGIRVQPVPQALTAEFEVIRFDKVAFPAQPFESRFQPSFETRMAREKATVPAGSFFVPIQQPLGRLAMNLLEPAAPDSVVRWGLMNSIFEQKEYASDYIFEPLAETMLTKDAKLKADFEAALAADPALARNPRARLLWLYKRSPFYEPDKDVYPILRALP